MTRRLCRIQGDADDRSQSGVQTLHALCDDQHWRYGRFFPVRPLLSLGRFLEG